jgi:hypothetical protein
MSDVVEVRAEEGAGSRRLSVSRPLESRRTLNTKVVGFGVWSLEVVQRCGENTYEQGGE